MTRGSKIFSTIIFVFVTVVSYFLLRDVKIDDSDIMETTINKLSIIGKKENER